MSLPFEHQHRKIALSVRFCADFSRKQSGRFKYGIPSWGILIRRPFSNNPHEDQKVSAEKRIPT
jgi:hypothetical protein